MSTVINLPQGQSLSGSIGNTLGSIIAQQGAATMQALEAARFQKIQNSIASAPDRNTAIAIATQLPFKNMQEFEHTMKYLDQYHPQSEYATTENKTYDAQGNEVTSYVPKKALLSQAPQTKLHQEDAYVKNADGTYEYYGKQTAPSMSKDMQTPGAIGFQNIDADNKRADEAAKHTDSNEARLQQQAAFSQQQTGLNNYARELFINLGGKPHMGPDGTMMLDAESLPYDKLASYKNGLAAGGDLMQKYGNDYGKAVKSFIDGDVTAKSVVTQPPPAPVVPKAEPKPGIIRQGIDAVKNFVSPSAKMPDAKAVDVKTEAPKQSTPASADFGNLRAAIKGVPPTTPTDVTEDPHNPTVYYPRTGADMKDVPDGSTFLNPADGKHYVKTAPVVSKTEAKITVGPPLKPKPDGDLHMSDIPKDGKFYQNVIYRDGEDRFMVDANGNRKPLDIGDNMFGGTSKKSVPESKQTKVEAKRTPQGNKLTEAGAAAEAIYQEMLRRPADVNDDEIYAKLIKDPEFRKNHPDVVKMFE